MSNINEKNLDAVTIKEVKELDEFLKEYNKVKETSPKDLKSAVIEASDGKITDAKFDAFVDRLKNYTIDESVPTEAEWAEIRTLFRDGGNQKIKASKERLEDACKRYTGEASIEDESKKLLSPSQVVNRLKDAESNIKIAREVKVIVAIILGAFGFISLVLVSRMLVNLVLEDVSQIIVQIVGGVLAIIGLGAGSFLGLKLMGAVEYALKRERNLAEVTESNHHQEIVKLQTEIKSAEENIKRIEAQYEVEILAQTDFSNLLKTAKSKEIEPSA